MENKDVKENLEDESSNDKDEIEEESSEVEEKLDKVYEKRLKKYKANRCSICHKPVSVFLYEDGENFDYYFANYPGLGKVFLCKDCHENINELVFTKVFIAHSDENTYHDIEMNTLGDYGSFVQSTEGYGDLDRKCFAEHLDDEGYSNKAINDLLNFYDGINPNKYCRCGCCDAFLPLSECIRNKDFDFEAYRCKSCNEFEIDEDTLKKEKIKKGLFIGGGVLALAALVVGIIFLVKGILWFNDLDTNGKISFLVSVGVVTSIVLFFVNMFISRLQLRFLKFLFTKMFVIAGKGFKFFRNLWTYDEANPNMNIIIFMVRINLTIAGIIFAAIFIALGFLTIPFTISLSLLFFIIGIIGKIRNRR